MTNITQISNKEELQERRLASLRMAFGDTILAALEDPEVIEIRLNDDSNLFIEKHGGKALSGTVSVENAWAIMRILATSFDVELTKEDPVISGVLPLDGSRFHGMAPPIVARPSFAIRKKALKIFPLDDYVRKRVLTFRQAEYIRKAIVERKNILVVGSTKSGKTTFCNAVLHEMSMFCPGDRMILIEDTQELQCTLEDRLFMLESEWTKMDKLTKSTMRMSPERISIGETRSGAPALDLLKSWNTGHSGGLSTIHADSAYEGLIRIDQLIQEVTSLPQRELIARAINICIFLKSTESGRRVEEIIEVNGYDFDKRVFLTRAVQ